MIKIVYMKYGSNQNIVIKVCCKINTALINHYAV
jgi:hypothetical protein